MKIYLDLLLLFNFLIDLLLLLSVASILKRRVSFYRLVGSAFLGSFSVFFLFLPLSNFVLLFLKFGMSMMMILVAYSYRDIRTFLKNLGYFYFASILLGGSIYLWNSTFSFGGIQNSFVSNSYQLNFFGLLFLSPIIIAYYVRKMKGVKEQYAFYQKVRMLVDHHAISGVGYADSGNTLTYKKKPVILARKNLLENKNASIYLPYQTALGIGMLACFPVEEVYLDNKVYKNIYVGIMQEDILMDGVDFLLHQTMIGGLYD